ncbi:hypothetical protein [Nonomuraea sp. NPDC049784]|uniref:hypothetical protein n=1 Tax=Nonomuraea sp. NPDC049784 TaxID=3154361 RepID=UPI00340DC41B
MSLFKAFAAFAVIQLLVVGTAFELLALARADGEDPFEVGPYKMAAYVALALSFALTGVLAAWSIKRRGKGRGGSRG